MIGHTAKKKLLALNTIIEEDVPEVIEADSNRLRQILINLVGNAIKFTEPGGRIDLRIRKNGDCDDEGNLMIQFEVQDTGIGKFVTFELILISKRNTTSSKRKVV